MARYKAIHKGLKLLPVNFEQQVMPGSFEYALCYLVDHELDLTAFHTRYKNDTDGAPAFDPAVLIKIILLAYSRGLISSRKIELACRENVLFMAVSGDSQPHFTTIAAFISDMGDLVTKLFAQVLLVCDRQGLIGREMFAIDGVKLPSNASKAKSGTRADYQRQAEKMEKAAQAILKQHQVTDHMTDEVLAKREVRKLERLQQEAKQLREWLKTHPEDRKGSKGSIRLSNRTDNDSAKMATSKGVIQGYTGVAAVDEKAQIIVDAQAHGTGSEQALLLPVIEATTHLRNNNTILTADAGYHSRDNINALAEQKINAYIPDNGYRKRDERYADQYIHQAKPDPLWNKKKTPKKSPRFKSADFQLAKDHSHAICPAGKRLYLDGANCTIKGYRVIKFSGTKRDCIPCHQRHLCLRKPEKTVTRQVSFFQEKQLPPINEIEQMKIKIDSSQGKEMITRRFATVEPVFGNLRGNKQLHRFTLRGKNKVDGQWKLYCMVHNIEKLANHGYAR